MVNSDDVSMLLSLSHVNDRSLLNSSPDLHITMDNKCIKINNNYINFTFYYVENNLYAVKINDFVSNDNFVNIAEYIKTTFNIELLNNDEIPYYSTNNIEEHFVINDILCRFNFEMFNNVILQISLIDHYQYDENQIDNHVKKFIKDKFKMDVYAFTYQY